jgi:hypothetical protein
MTSLHYKKLKKLYLRCFHVVFLILVEDLFAIIDRVFRVFEVYLNLMLLQLT